MAKKKISVMISSRCKDQIEHGGVDTELSSIRRQLKKELEDETLFGIPLFEVWINETASAGESSTNSTDTCLDEIRRADIVLVLYNGNGGWAADGSDVGICHAELQTALETAAAKVRVIALPVPPIETSKAPDRDRRFREYVNQQSPFHCSADTGEDVIRCCKNALRDAVADMVGLGVREARKGKFHTGEALAWSRLDGQGRRSAMEDTLRRALRERKDTEEIVGQIFVPIDGAPIMATCSGAPASLTNAAAREMVGQPFLRDHEWTDILQPPRCGPIHVIACHRAATETQATRLLGAADAFTVTAPFGVLAVDGVTHVQLALLSNCRDETTTRYGVQRLFEWLQLTGEDALVRRRAESRTQIVKAIAAATRHDAPVRHE